MNTDFIVHSSQSFVDYLVGVDKPGQYKVALSSDEGRFGGHDRIDIKGNYFTTPMEWNGRNNWLQVRLLSTPKLIAELHRSILRLVRLSYLRFIR